MKNDIKGLKVLYDNDNFSVWGILKLSLNCFVSALSTIPFMIWRVIYGILLIICGILKSFKLLFKPKQKYTYPHKYDRCPKCGKEFTIYNHRFYYKGVCYTFCECGYDSREEK